MKFLLAILEDPARVRRPEELERIVEEHRRFAAELTARNRLVEAERLGPRPLRVTIGADGRRTTHNAPAAGAREVLGGFYLLECGSIEEASEFARRCPMLEGDAVELWPYWET